ncbi:uncharacterized protein LOC144737935 [Lampetra planeri]
MNHRESAFLVMVMVVAVHVTNSANSPIQHMAAVEGEDVLFNCSTSSTIDRLRWRYGQSNTTILFRSNQSVTPCNPLFCYVVFSGNLSSGNGSIALISVPVNASGMYLCFLETSTADHHHGMVYNLTIVYASLQMEHLLPCTQPRRPLGEDVTVYVTIAAFSGENELPD